ncbi:glycoside hydrolase family 92 protein [Rhodocollybia butyracea]|uniref:Glycoside hydrolase family 92 protein n=1 Tax=Rhodocollybia butyracea TaxID=206335 RepID=A0A9P5PB14_9AGAR|nr:glycoside hydrolase family 92 protein [Rhodocollybia butyracea]
MLASAHYQWITFFFLLFFFASFLFIFAPESIVASSQSFLYPAASTLVRAEIFIQNPAEYVLPFIGTTNGGHVFPGATLPHGMVKAGLDTNSPDNQAGYDANPMYDAIGFSQLHDSGTGGWATLSNFKIWPYASCPSFTECPTHPTKRAVPRKLLPDGSVDDAASPGYFATNLSTDIRVELTATHRTALHRYTFPSNSTEPRLLLDLTTDGMKQGYKPTMLIEPIKARITGDAWFQGSFGPGEFHLFTCVDFKGEGYDFGNVTEYGSWHMHAVEPNTITFSGVYSGAAGAVLTFSPATNGTTSILTRVGVSFISSAQACRHAEEEIPDWDFERVQSDALGQWNELLRRVQIDPTGVDEETVQLFYSGLYRTHIIPADYTGENPRWESSEPYYDSYYCNWDTFRTLFPLFSLHDPERFALITRAMIDIWRFEGWLPECRGSTLKYWIQGGSNADPILSEFFVKYHEYAALLNVSASDLYDSLVTDAEVEPGNWDLQGRQATEWVNLNYIPDGRSGYGGASTRQVSRTLEYAFGDFTISQVAKILGKTTDAAKFTLRANGSFNMWNSNTTLPGFPSVTGMMQLKSKDGVFDKYTDPRHCSVNDPKHATCYLDPSNHDGFYEASPAVYSQYVPHDTAQLINFQGGVDKFIERLDILFNQSYFAVTNEPSHQIPFMYHYANRPGLSTKQSRRVIFESFNTSINGLPGNDDSGAMGSYTVFLLSGLYPIPGTKQFLLSSPFFPTVAFSNPLFNTTTTIKAVNWAGNPPDGVGTVYVSNVTINGVPYKSNCYLEWDLFRNNTLVELTLSDDPTLGCGSGADALPPSLSTGGFD